MFPTPASPQFEPSSCRSAPAAARILAFCLALAATLPRLLRAENSLAYKYQDYQEADDRIRVRNHNARATLDLGTATALKVRGVIDTISGATPTGAPAPDGSDEVPLAVMEDERSAVVVDLAHTFGMQTVNLQYAYSTEDDYTSSGYALTWLCDFNEKNTQLQLGFAYTDDRIHPVFFSEGRNKDSRDVMAGLVQLIDRNTVLTVNLTLGNSSGYLSDPYKLVQKTVEILPGFPLPLTFAENRPDSRDKTIVFAQVARHFEPAHASLEASVRFYSDSHGIDSDTLEMAWLQKVGERWVLSPYLRYYRQGQADFYYYDLDQSAIVPAPEPDGSAPHYSSDYRLSQFEATTLGLKLTYRHDDRWSADVAVERYDMRGRDGVTPASAYATADIVTGGISLWF
ncbi:MAG: DUF3570 domain-containing protein [Opitutaceae bacterium]|nr:DUF3570 domain-containing protein [Opitutaceae bacterium]